MRFKIRTSRLLCRVISSLLMLVSSLFCINLGFGASRSRQFHRGTYASTTTGRMGTNSGWTIYAFDTTPQRTPAIMAAVLCR